MAAFIYPLWNASPVLRTALRVRTVRVMAIDSEQDAHTRHVGTAWRTQSDGAAGAVEAARPVRAQQAAGFDLRHQTLAAWPETRRGSAETGGRAADAWRSRARRPDRNAGREPKGASFRLLLLVLAIDVQQLCRKVVRKRLSGSVCIYC